MKVLLTRTGFLAILGGFIASGCSTLSSGPSDEALIAALLNQWEQGVREADVDKLMATFSDDFAHDGSDYQAKDTAALREFIEGSIDEGLFKDVELSLDDAEIKVNGDSASVYPIDYATLYGGITIELTLDKEGKDWLITDMELIGM